MTQSTKPNGLSGFEERLLVELKDVVSQRSHMADSRTSAHSWTGMWRGAVSTGKRRLALGVGVVAAGALVAAALTFSPTGARPPAAAVPAVQDSTVQDPAAPSQIVPVAYTLQRQADGQIKITIRGAAALDVTKLAVDLKNMGLSVTSLTGVSDTTTCPAGQPAMRLMFLSADVSGGGHVVSVPDQEGSSSTVVGSGVVDYGFTARPGEDIVVIGTGTWGRAGQSNVTFGMWFAKGTPTCVNFPHVGPGTHS